MGAVGDPQRGLAFDNLISRQPGHTAREATLGASHLFAHVSAEELFGVTTSPFHFAMDISAIAGASDC